MRRIRDRVGALDVHRDSVMAACRSVDPSTGEIIEDVNQFSTMSAGLATLAVWLLDRHVTTVAMESTGVCWKPVVRHEALFDRERMRGPLLRAVAAAR